MRSDLPDLGDILDIIAEHGGGIRPSLLSDELHRRGWSRAAVRKAVLREMDRGTIRPGKSMKMEATQVE